MKLYSFLLYIYEHICALEMAIDWVEITGSEIAELFSADATYFKCVTGLWLRKIIM